MMLPFDIQARDGNLEWDIPGPYTLQWSKKTARDRVHEEAIPVAFGVAVAATPYLVGAAIVAFAPPPFKPVGYLMLFPNPVADAAYFAVGYGIGKEVQEEIW